MPHKSEKNRVLKKHVFGREDFVIESYIVHGPTSLKEYLKVSEDDWQVIFDYLIFEKDLLQKCVNFSPSFFDDTYIKHGMTHLRDILEVTAAKYDDSWEKIFDFIVIANDNLLLHVIEHRDRYVIAMKARGADFVRKVLGIWKGKYDENWAKVLDFLLNAVCSGLFSERTFEHGLIAFSKLMNGVREHRPVFKHKFF